MSEIVICDTNAVIHLAIICPEIIKKPNDQYRLVIHPIVKQEIQKLLLVPEKEKRLGEILKFIANEVMADTKIGLPPKDREIRLHRRIQLLESGLDPRLLSSGSSHQDRCFLIIAYTKEAQLLTNEKTLHSLGNAFLGEDRVFRTSKVLEMLVKHELATQDSIQIGLKNLKKYEERVHDDCIQKLKEIGFQI